MEGESTEEGQSVLRPGRRAGDERSIGQPVIDPERSFPAGLLDWAGNRVGGVRRLFHASSGRPSGRVIKTPLLARLSAWAKGISRGQGPRAILLIGGPGNGKTEAIEHTIVELDSALGLGGQLVERATSAFGGAALRLVRLELDGVKDPLRYVSIVQDASASHGANVPPPAALVGDLVEQVIREPDSLYLACINRGVLDDALIHATDSGEHDAAHLLGSIIRSVGVTPEAPVCWPLDTYPMVGVWPMDVESLVEEDRLEGSRSAAAQLIDLATDEAKWPTACVAGDKCPFCTSRRQLAREPHRSSLLAVLRWYEIATGKRWTFRDLFSLVSYLLAGMPSDESTASPDPCKWAGEMIALASRADGKPESLRLAVPFTLVASQYQHALFMTWPRHGVRALRKDIVELQLERESTLMGFYHFLARRSRLSYPETLESQLEALCEALDPAIADPDLDAPVSNQTTVKLREFDVRFSKSVGEGFRYARKFQFLSDLEVAVLQRLDETDRRLSDPSVVKKKFAVAARIQRLLRDFSCRLVRRSVGARSAVVYNKPTLVDFQRVVEGDDTLLHAAAKQVEGLLNEKERFIVHLNTTFGEPLPPEQRRAILATEKQKVKAWQVAVTERPDASIRFLGVGTAGSLQSIPLTYELFRSVRELRHGMMPASLPRTVMALLDTTRARLAGRVVRDSASLDGAEIHIAGSSDVIVREIEKFVVLPGEGRNEP